MPIDHSTTYHRRALPMRPDEPPAPSFRETAGAAWRQENIIGSLASSEKFYETISGGFYDIDDAYNVYDDPDFKGYEDYSDRFENVFNRRAFEALKTDIDLEKKDRETLARSGWTGTALTMGATIVDPTILLPGGAFVKAGKLGYAAGRTALNVGVAAGASTAVQESILQGSQELRTGSESAFNIGGSVVMGALLGGAVAKAMTAAEWRRAGQVLKKALDDPSFDAGTDALHRDMMTMGNPNSAGAAAAPRDTLDDLTIADPAAATAARATARLNPAMRLLHSPSLAAREVANQLFENSAYLKKHLTGRGDQAVESLVRLHEGSVGQALEATNAAYRNARRGGVKMTRRQFNEAVGVAMRRGDVSDVPGVSEAAKAWRSQVFDPLKDRAIKSGLLPEDVTVQTAQSYFSRMWNRHRIEADEANFRQVVRNWIDGRIDAQAAKEVARIDRRITDLQSEVEALETGMLRRREDWRYRAEGREPTLEDVGGLSAVQLVRRYRSGERPKSPERLTEWLRRQAREGIYDPAGDLATVFPEARKIPGMLRNTRRTDKNTKGGWSLDDLVLRAWEEGFLNDAGTVRVNAIRDTVSERPDINTFLDLLDADIRGERHVVRISDQELARAAEEFDNALQALERAGIDLDRPMFGFSEQTISLRGVGDMVIDALDALDNQKLGQLRGRMDELGQRRQFEFLSDADRAAYIDEIVEGIFQNVTGRGGDILPGPITITKRGPLKERVFDIPDELVEKYLDSDVELAGRRYARMMSADIELKEKFGSITMEDQLAAIRQEFSELRAKVEADGSLKPKDKAAALKRLSTEERENVRDLEAVRDMLRGHYRPDIEVTNFSRISAGVRAVNYLRTMGGVTVSSLTDIVQPAMAHGLKSYVGDLIVPMFRNMKAVKMSVAEARKAGLVYERVLANRIASLAEVTDPYSQSLPIENLLRNLTAGFSRATGILHWTDMMQAGASVLTQDRILRNAAKAAERGFDSLSSAEKKFMGELGIGVDRAEAIGRLFQAHGDMLDGVRVANTDAWGDEGLVRAYRAAVSRDVTATIIEPGVGDVPLFGKTSLGKAVLQFKSFMFASNQRILVRQLGRDRGRFLGGLVGLVGMGMFIEWLKNVEAGRDLPTNPGYWIASGLDRSGVFSIGFEVNNSLAKVLPDVPDVYSMAQLPFGGVDAKAGRYAVRSVVDAAAGPSAGTIADTLRLLQMATRGDVNEGDIGAMRRMTPFASLPYFRWMIDGMVVPAAKEAVK